MKSRYSSLLLLIFTIPLFAADDEKTSDELMRWSERSIYADLGYIEKFWLVSVSVSPPNPIALNANELTEFAQLKFKNTFTGFPFEQLPRDEKRMSKIEDIDQPRWGGINISIRLVGKDFPVAYFIELRMFRLGKASGEYRNSTLGYANAKALREERILKDAIADLMDQAAATLLRVQKKL